MVDVILNFFLAYGFLHERFAEMTFLTDEELPVFEAPIYADEVLNLPMAIVPPINRATTTRTSSCSS